MHSYGVRAKLAKSFCPPPPHFDFETTGMRTRSCPVIGDKNGKRGEGGGRLVILLSE